MFIYSDYIINDKMINVKQITSIYSIDILHNMIKPIFGGNLYYMGLTDTMK